MLYGQRVTIRPVVEEDWIQRYEWLSDPTVNRTLPSGSGMPITPSVVKERVLGTHKQIYQLSILLL